MANGSECYRRYDYRRLLRCADYQLAAYAHQGLGPASGLREETPMKTGEWDVEDGKDEVNRYRGLVWYRQLGLGSRVTGFPSMVGNASGRHCGRGVDHRP